MLADVLTTFGCSQNHEPDRLLLGTISMTISIVDIFSTPYSVNTSKNNASEQTGDGCLTIKNCLDAAKYIAEREVDNRLDDFINAELDRNHNFVAWKKHMPSRTPRIMSRYQQEYQCYNNYNMHYVDNVINSCGIYLPIGQQLFHGGQWWGKGEEVVTKRPLSLTFSPQVAMRNAEHLGKAYDAGWIDIFVVTIKRSDIKAFVFKRHGTNFGHENEILLSSNITLRLVTKMSGSIEKIFYKSDQEGTNEKTGPIYILQVDII